MLRSLVIQYGGSAPKYIVNDRVVSEADYDVAEWFWQTGNLRAYVEPRSLVEQDDDDPLQIRRVAETPERDSAHALRSDSTLFCGGLTNTDLIGRVGFSASMRSTTCWNCYAPYLDCYDVCQHCGRANANRQFDTALTQWAEQTPKRGAVARQVSFLSDQLRALLDSPRAESITLSELDELMRARAAEIDAIGIMPSDEEGIEAAAEAKEIAASIVAATPPGPKPPRKSNAGLLTMAPENHRLGRFW